MSKDSFFLSPLGYPKSKAVPALSPAGRPFRSCGGICLQWFSSQAIFAKGNLPYYLLACRYVLCVMCCCGNSSWSSKVISGGLMPSFPVSYIALSLLGAFISDGDLSTTFLDLVLLSLGPLLFLISTNPGMQEWSSLSDST